MDLNGPPLTTRGLLAAIEVIRTRGSRTIIAGSVVGLIGVGLVDWWTGPDVNVSVGYALVTVFAAFSISMRFGFGLAVAVAAWSFVIATWHPDSTPHMPTVSSNTALRLLFFLLLAAGASALRSVVDELDRLAGTDALTGVWNRRALVAILDREAARAERTEQPLTIAYLDLRSLKHINDQFGHTAGDDLIRSLARGLVSGLRRGDIVARVGGDEFVILLPNVKVAAATALVQRVLETPEVPAANAGLVEFDLIANGGSPDADDMIRRADEAMYHAKTNGLPVHAEAWRPVERPGRLRSS